jgi:hypothetical protein
MQEIIHKIYIVGGQVPMGVPDPYGQPQATQTTAALGRLRLSSLNCHIPAIVFKAVITPSLSLRMSQCHNGPLPFQTLLEIWISAIYCTFIRAPPLRRVPYSDQYVRACVCASVPHEVFRGVFSTPFHIGTWNLPWGSSELSYTSSSRFIVVPESSALWFFTTGHMHVTVFYIVSYRNLKLSMRFFWVKLYTHRVCVSSSWPLWFRSYVPLDLSL